MRRVQGWLVLVGLGAVVMCSGGICEVVAEGTCDDGYVRPVGTSGGSVGDFGAGGDADAARLEAFLDAMVRLEVESNRLESSTEDACRAIGQALEVPAADMPEGDMEATCSAVADQVEADRQALQDASITLSVDVVQGGCSVQVDAAADCYASCDVDVDVEATPPRCEGGTMVVRCEAGCSECHLPSVSAECTGRCEGSCSGSCTGTCEGRCEGTCTGACDGYCDAEGSGGECAGRCDGTCEGECSASCSGSCEGSCSGGCEGECIVEVTEGGCDECYAGCDVEGEPLRCEGGELVVEASAECEAACDAELSLDAECTPPLVFVTLDGDLAGIEDTAARYVDALEVGLPALLEIAEQAGLVLDAMVVVADTAGEGMGAAVNLGAKAIACAGLTVAASVDIRVKVQASVNASVEVSGAAQVSSEG